MSKTVDERVVQMEFDNAQFEKNVKTSMSTIDKLNNSLNLLESSKSFENIADSSKKVDLSTLTATVQNLGSKFSTMSIIAIGALEEIGRKAVNVGQNLVRSLAIDPIKDGFSEYELKMGSVQTIMAGSGESLDVVMDKLNELNAYADRTIYSFSDMTTNIGKFTNAGVDLKTSVAAIQGVANVAAVSGANAQEASRAMYNFAQALSSGYVKLIDWKSIENANMATVEFKNQLLEAAVAAGTVEKTADGMYQVLGTNAQGATMKEAISATKNFNDSLSYQWMTTEVLTSTLAKYSDETTEIGKKAFAAAQDVKTFSQLMDTLKEAVGSGWAETWENVFGNFEEAKALWTGVNNVVSGFIDRQAKARNALLSTWKGAGGRDDLIAAFSNIFNQLSGIAKAVRKTFTDMFPPATASSLWKLTKRFREFSESLYLVHAKAFAIRSELGDNIVKTFKGVFAAIGIVKDVVVALIKPIGSLFSGLGKASGGILSMTANLGDYLVNLKDTIEQSGVLEEITERLSKVFATIGGFISNLVGSISQFVNLLKSTFKIDGGVSAFVGFINSILTNITTLIFDVISALTGKDLSNARDGVIGFFNKISDVVLRVWDTVKPVITGIIDLFSGAFSSIKEFFGSFGGIDLKPAEDFSEKTEKAFLPLKTFLEGVKKLFQGVAELFKALKPILSGIISAIGRVLGVIGGAIGEIVKNFDFSKLTEILTGGLKVGIGIKILGFVNGLKKAADKAPKVVDSVRAMFKSISKLFDSFTKMAEAKTLEKKTKALRNIAISVGILAAALFVISSIEPHKLQSAMTAVTTMIIELVGALKLLGQIDKKTNIKKMSQTMLGLSASVLILAFAVSVLAKLDPSAMGQAMIALSLLLGEMVAAMMLLSGKKAKRRNMMEAAENAMAFAASIAILAFAVSVLAKLDPSAMGQATMALSLLLGEMVAAVKILSNDKSSSMLKGAGNALVFAIALRVLVSSVKNLAKLQPEALINGMVSITVLIAAMVYAAKELGNDQDSTAMLKGAGNALIFAVALRVLVSSVKSLGKMSVEQLVTGLIGIGALLGAMVLAAKEMKGSEEGAKSMLVASAALLVLAVSLKALGSLSLDQIIKGLIAIGGAFVILAIGAELLDPVTTTLFKVAGAMALIGLSAVLFGAGMLMISAAFTALGGSIMIAVDAIIAAVISLITALPDMIGALAQSLQEAGTDIITCLVEVAKAALIALKEVVPEAVEVVLDLIMTTLSSLAEHIQPIVESLLDIVVGVINGLATGMPEIITATITLLKSIIEAIMGAFDGLSMEDLLEASAALALFGVMMGELAAISVLALVAVLPLPTVGAKLSQFIEAAEPFLRRIQEVDPASLQGAKALAEMILILTANGILDALTSWFTGGSSMVDFGKQLAEFAPYMKQYADEIKGIDSGAVEASANAALALANMATNLPNSGGVVSWFTGDNSLSDFADELVKFGPKLKQYADSVTGLNPMVVINSVLAAKSISNFAENLPNSGGVASWFAGENSLAAFGEELAEFGPHLKAYSDSVKGMDSSVVIRSMQAAQAISNFAENLPNNGGVVSWFSGDNTISKFGEGLAEFGGYLLQYSLAVQGINVASFMAIIPGLEALVAIGQDIEALSSSSIGTFAEAFTDLATNGVNGLINTFVDSTPEVTDAIDGMLTNALDHISSQEELFKKAGTKLADQLVAGIKVRQMMIKTSFNTSLISTIQMIRSYYLKFRESGSYLVQGFANGIDSSRWKAEAAGRAMVKKTFEAVQAEEDAHSPSRKAEIFGGYLVDGFIKPIYDRISDLRAAGKTLAAETIDATNNVISRIADYFSSDIDTQPTIRPVLDLTDVTDGFGQLNAMFTRKQALGISASMAGSGSVDVTENGNAPAIGNSFNFTQNNYSPKALSASEIYRYTKNQFSQMKGVVNAR